MSIELVNNFFKAMKNDTEDKNVYILTHNKSDGLGDAGQIGYLYDYLSAYKAEYKIKGLDTFVSYSDDSCMNKIKELSRTESELVFAEDNSIMDMFFNPIIKKLEGETQNNYYIVYPNTISASIATNAKTLCISEMNYGSGEIVTGTSGAKSIGFGIPKWESKRTTPESDKTWLVSAKKYLASSTSSTDAPEIAQKILTRIIELAKLMQVKHIKFITALNFELNNKNNELLGRTIRLSTLVSLSQDDLRSNMDNIEDGMIISGGEGMFVESLGSNTDVPCILCARYDYQYQEILHALLTQSNQIIQIVSKDNNAELEKYCFFNANLSSKNTYLYYNKGNFYDILDNLRVVTIESVQELKTNETLAAFYLPFYMNALDLEDIKMPTCFHQNETKIEDIYKQLRVQLSQSNWFSIIDSVSKS